MNSNIITTALAHPLVKKYRPFVLYAIIGASGALLDLLVFLFLYNVLHLNPIVANVISVSLGIINNFILNVLFNFKVRDRLAIRFAMFYTVGIFGLLVSVAILYILHTLLGTSANLAKLVSIPIVVILQYFFNSRFSLANILNIETVFGNKDINKYLSRIPRVRSTSYSVLEVIILAFSAIMMIANSLIFLLFQDEHDNFMGGVYINHGHLPYEAFFSHHMPLAYYIASILTFFTHGSFVHFRILLGLLLFAWLLIIYSNLRRVLSKAWGMSFVVLFVFLQPVFSLQSMLAETLTAFAVLHFISWLMTSINNTMRRPSMPMLVLITSLCLVPVLSELSYTLLSLLMVGVLWYVLATYGTTTPLKFKALWKEAIGIALAATPLLLLLVLSIVGVHAAHAFVFDALTFNTKYYSLFDATVQPTLAGTAANMFLTPFISLFNLTSSYHGSADLLNIVSLMIYVLFVIVSLFMLGKGKVRNICLLVALLTFGTITRTGALPFTNFHAGPFGAITLLMIMVLGYLAYENLITHAFTAQISFLLSLFIAFFMFAFAMHADSQQYLAIANNARSYVSSQLTPYNDRYTIFKKVAVDNGQTFWSGPLDFYSFAKFPNTRSSYYNFYLPWQAACPSCSARLGSDLSSNSPVVIYWLNDASIWGVPVKAYGSTVNNLLAINYFQEPDPRLQDFYFLRTAHESVNKTLKELGYVTE